MPSEKHNVPDPSNIELVAEPIAAGVTAILGVIPFLGVPAAMALSTWQTQNYKKLACAVRENFSRIDQTKLNKTFLESDEFKELLIQTVEASIRSASDEKCKALSNALLNAAIQPTCEFSNKLGIIRVISQMSDEERLVLRVLYDHLISSNPDGPFIGVEKISEHLQISSSDALTSLDGLQQLGLAYDFINTFAGFDSRRGLWSLTTLGAKSIQYSLAA